MKDFEAIRKAIQVVDPHAREVKMVIRTLDPDHPYTLHWEVALETQSYSVGQARNEVLQFLYNFNDFFLGVDIVGQKVTVEEKES